MQHSYPQMPTSTEQQKKLQMLQLVKTNSSLAQFQALQELKSIAIKTVEDLFEEHKKQMEREMRQMVEDIKRNDPINAGFIDKIVNKTVAQLVRDTKGDVGEPGYTPIRGTDYFTENDITVMVNTVFSRIPISKDGVDGYTPVEGVDYPSKREIREYVLEYITTALSRIPKAESGKTPIKGVDYFTERDIQEILKRFHIDIPEVTGEVIVQKVNTLEIKPEKQIDASHIKNLPKFIERVNARRTLHRGGAEVRVYDLSASTDGTTKTFTVPGHSSAIMVTGTDFPLFYRLTVDFTVSGTTLTLTSEVPAPTSGASLFFWYNT